MDKIEFEAPILEILELDIVDVIATSDPEPEPP